MDAALATERDSPTVCILHILEAILTLHSVFWKIHMGPDKTSLVDSLEFQTVRLPTTAFLEATRSRNIKQQKMGLPNSENSQK